MTIKMFMAKLSFDQKVRSRLYRKLAAMTRHNLGIVMAVSSIQSRMHKRNHLACPILDHALARLKAGQKLNVAFAEDIPGEEAMLMRGGELSGNLPETLELAASIIDARQKIVSGVREALGYPVLLMSMLLLLLFVVSHHVVPQLALINDPANWRGGARMLYLVASFVNSGPGVVCIIFPAILLVVAIATMRHWTGPLRVLCDRIPPWSFYRLINGCVWLFTLATLLQANVQISHALDTMLDMSSTSPWLKERIRAIKSRLQLGKSFGQALDEAGHDFPDREIIDDLLVYSTLPGFEQRLHLIAEEWLEAGLERAKAQAKIINTTCICGIIAMLSGVGLAVSSLQQFLGHGLI